MKNDRNESLKMCIKLKMLNGMNANDLLNKVGQNDIIPVDVAQICRDLQIFTKPFDFSVIENNEEYQELVMEKGNILGIVLAEEDNLAILYRDSDSKNRKRFTLAHELAHCCLHMSPTDEIHIEFRIDANSTDDKEMEANIFAGELLIPENCLRRIIGNSPVTSRMAISLSNLFVVSLNVMLKRLRHLNIEIIDE